MNIHGPTPSEVALASTLRSMCIRVIDGLPDRDVGTALGLAPSGLDRLLDEDPWNVNTAIRVADCIGVPVLGMPTS